MTPRRDRTVFIPWDLPPPVYREPRPKPPGFLPHLEPRTNHAALAELLRRRGPALAAADLARWQLAPRIAARDDGNLGLTALHDPSGKPLLEYRRDPDGRVQTVVSGPPYEMHRSLRQQGSRSDRPSKPPPASSKARRSDALRLPGAQPAKAQGPAQNTVLPCSIILGMLTGALARRLLETACAIASDYLPNWAVRDALAAGPRGYPRPKHAPPEDLTNIARQAALRAVLDTVALPSRKAMLMRHRSPSWPEPASAGELNRHYSLPRRRPRGSDAVAAAGQTNHDLAHRLLAEPVLQTLAALSEHPKQSRHALLADTTPGDYDRVRKSLEAYAGLVATAPGLARLHFTELDDGRRKTDSPGELVKRTRRWARLTPAQWRIFHQLAEEPRNRTKNLDAIRQTARLAGLANVPGASRSTLLTLHHTLPRLDAPEYSRGPGRRASTQPWVRTINAYLRRNPADPGGDQLRWVGDALARTLNRHRPWGKGDWAAMLSRANRVHLERLAQLPEQDDAWRTALDRHRSGPYLLTPLTSREALRKAGRYMGAGERLPRRNTPSGRHDNQRFFLATAPGRGPALLCLSAATGSWQPDGILTGGGRKPYPALTALLADLASRYAAADPNPRRTSWFAGRDRHNQPEPAAAVAPAHRPPSFQEIVGEELMNGEQYASPTQEKA